jgi:acetyl esterase/lipase
MLTDTDRVQFDGLAEPQFHPELRRAAAFIPRFSVGPKTANLLRALRRRRPVPPPPAVADVSIRDEHIARPGGDPLRIRIFSPSAAGGPRPALLWMHGGGFIVGHPESDQARSIALCRSLDIVVATVNYRLGPNHPFPQPLEDCHEALAWLHAQAGTLGIDPARVAVGGASAGAGLAAGLALLAHDRGGPPIAFQLLVYPMIDDRTSLRTDIDERRLRMWSRRSNYTGWRSYLGQEPGGQGIPAYAAPSRREDLSGLPPAWIGVGTCDLFLDEDIAYAARLNAAGVPCTLKMVPGAFHTFDLVAPKAHVAADFRQSYFDALQAGLYGQDAQRSTSRLPRAGACITAA